MLKRATKSIYLITMLFILAACGGGGSLSRDDNVGGGGQPGGGNGSPTTPTEPTVTMTIASSDGEDTNELTEDTPLVVSALVETADGDPVNGELVTFTLSSDTLATFDNDTGTALTGTDGVATIGLLVGPSSGSGLVTGSLNTGETGTVGFVSEGTTVAVEQPATLDLFASQPQLSSSGSDTIELRAIIKNDQNVLLEGIDVEFSANEGASIQNVQTTTDALGTALARLTTTNNPENRIITAVAAVVNSPELTQSVQISVVGTDISIIGPNSIIVGDSAELTVLLEDSENNGIPDETVVIAVSDGTGADVTEQVLDQSTFVTSVDGRGQVNFSASSSGTYSIVASSLNTATVFAVTVQQDQFVFVDPPDITNIEEDLPLNQDHVLSVEWLKDNTPFSGGSVSLSISRGVIVSDATVVTDDEGSADFTITSDNAGLASVLATGTDDEGNEVTARIDVSFIATDTNSVTVDASPDAIGPDGQTSTVSAVVRDAAGNRVGNKIVNFSLSDVSNGSLSPAQVTTDRRGIASTVYTSNAVSSNEAVQVTATVDGVTGDTTLTVGDRPFDISIGTGRLIQSPNNSSYRKEFSVFVTDADGNPVPNTDITVSITPLKQEEGVTYFKGSWFYLEDSQIHVPTGPLPEDAIAPTPITGCFNEDENFNGILDDGEDTGVFGNNDGQLTPGNAASITPSTVTTDENGQALVFVEYPRQFGAWVKTKITARGQSGGSESRESMFFTLTVALEDLNVEGSPPPSSPYGVGTICNNTN